MKTVSCYNWLKLALCNDPDRPSIVNPFVYNGWMYATDAHRAHREKTELKNHIFGRDVNDNIETLPKMDLLFDPLVKDPGQWVRIRFNDLEMLQEDPIVKWNNFSKSYFERNDFFEIEEQCYKYRYIADVFAGSSEMQYKKGIKDMLYMRSLDERQEAIIMKFKGVGGKNENR